MIDREEDTPGGDVSGRGNSLCKVLERETSLCVQVTVSFQVVEVGKIEGRRRRG